MNYTEMEAKVGKAMGGSDLYDQQRLPGPRSYQ